MWNYIKSVSLNTLVISLSAVLTNAIVMPHCDVWGNWPVGTTLMSKLLYCFLFIFNGMSFVVVLHWIESIATSLKAIKDKG